MIGPLAASTAFELGAGVGLFSFLASVQAVLTLIALYRLVVRPDRQ